MSKGPTSFHDARAAAEAPWENGALLAAHGGRGGAGNDIRLARRREQPDLLKLVGAGALLKCCVFFG